MTKRTKQPAYKWRETYRAAVDPDKAAAELSRVKRERGLTAEAVVEESRPDDAPLHPAFEWNDELAAENYRKEQARRLIRALVVVQHDETPEHRKYVLIRSDEPERRSTYEDMAVVVQDADLFADALGKLESEVHSARKSVAELESLAQANSLEPERLARIALAAKALEAVSAAVAGLH